MSSHDLREVLAQALGTAYSLERELGGGGMSRVFVAEERALGRHVVVKVLPPEVAQDVSLERFRREIRVLAALQHPNIVPVLGAGEADGMLYYTMPLIHGPSLRQRLTDEHALPVADVVSILGDVAAALVCAHERGIVHRDIKPDNILLSDGRALVTDFGIARAIASGATELESRTTLTQRGQSLGTPAYMSPEQVAGDQRVDHRSDLYSLGMVAYEALTGSSAFAGRSIQSLMAAQVTEPPVPITTIRPSTPTALATLVMRSLEKHPADRPQSARDLLRELGAVRSGDAGALVSLPGRPSGTPSRARRALPWIAAAALGASTVVLAVMAAPRSGARFSSSPEPRYWNIVLPESAPLVYVGEAELSIGRPALALSRDGMRLAYVSRDDSSTFLMLRRMDGPVSVRLPGTEGAFQPFFSPDGRWIGFFGGGELKRVSADGGRPTTLAQVTEPVGGMWLDDGRIIVAELQGSRLTEVPAAGGVPRLLHVLPVGGTSMPQALGDDWILGSSGRRRITLTSVATGAQRVLTREGFASPDSAGAAEVIHGTMAHHVASGHLVYLSSGENGVLMALPFDAERQRVLGPPVPVLSDVRQEAAVGGQFAVSDDGTIVFAAGGNAARSHLAWVRPSGAIDTLPVPPADYGEPHVSPDGRRVLVRLWPPGAPLEAWLIDLERGTHAKIPFGAPVQVFGGGWWPDGRSVVAMLSDSNVTVRRAIDGTALEDKLWRGGNLIDMSRDARRLVIGSPSGLRLVSQDAAAPLDTIVENMSSTIVENMVFPAVSPDGEWLAFTSRVSGHSEVYVAPFGDARAQHKISAGGGEEAVWSRDGRAIIYRNGPRWYAVQVTPGAPFVYGAPRLLFEGPYNNVPGWSHDVGPDGSHLVLVGSGTETTTRLEVITDWFSELRRLAPARGR